LDTCVNRRCSLGYFFFAFFAFFFATVFSSPPPWTFGARGALLYASSICLSAAAELGSYRAVPKGAKDSSFEFLARKFCSASTSPLFIGSPQTKLKDRSARKNFFCTLAPTPYDIRVHAEDARLRPHGQGQRRSCRRSSLFKTAWTTRGAWW
jgi:hypothetical protein